MTYSHSKNNKKSKHNSDKKSKHNSDKKSNHSSDKKSYVKKPIGMWTSRSFPALGVPVATILQNDSYTITIDNVIVKRTGQVFVEVNLSWLLAGQTTLMVDVQRDGMSITSGSQNLFIQPDITPTSTPFILNNTLEVVDTMASKGTHTYTINLTPSVSQYYAQILSYVANVKTFDKESNQIFVNQQFPSIETGDALNLFPNVIQSITLPVSHNGRATKLNANLNFNCSIHAVQLYLNILRDDGASVTNGFQPFININDSASALKIEDNLCVSIIDKHPSSSYTFELKNTSSDVINIDFYCFSAKY